jgi:hypothetical protein
MTDPRITLPRAPGLTSYRQLNRYFFFLEKFGSLEKFKCCHEHHIHPTKMGGSDAKVNLIYLTPRAHYIAHQLLFRAFTGNQQAQRAAWLMSHTIDEAFVNSRVYEFLKNNYIFSEETRNKLSEAGRNRKLSFESREKISISNKETYRNTSKEVLLERIERMRETKRGTPWNESHRNSIPPSLPRGRDHWRLKDSPLWGVSDEILKVWLENGKPSYVMLCRLLGIPKTKSVMSVIKSMI